MGKCSRYGHDFCPWIHKIPNQKLPIGENPTTVFYIKEPSAVRVYHYCTLHSLGWGLFMNGADWLWYSLKTVWQCSTHMSDTCLESLHTQLSQYEVCWFVYKSLIWSRTYLMFEFSLQYSYQLGNHQVLNASNDVTNFPWLLLPDSIYAFFLVLFHTSSKQI